MHRKHRTSMSTNWIKRGYGVFSNAQCRAHYSSPRVGGCRDVVGGLEGGKDWDESAGTRGLGRAVFTHVSVNGKLREVNQTKMKKGKRMTNTSCTFTHGLQCQTHQNGTTRQGFIIKQRGLCVNPITHIILSGLQNYFNFLFHNALHYNPL